MNNGGSNNKVRTSIATALGIALMLGLVAAPLATHAGSLQQAQGPRTLTIPAGGTVTLQSRAFCIDFGKEFPTGDMNGKGLANEKIMAALNYAISKGYTEGNPQQVELAVWFLSDGTWHATEHAIGQEIVDNATTAPPAATDGSASLADAVAQNKVSVTAKFVPQTKDNFYGDGDVQVKNLTGAELKIYVPIGQLFEAPAGNFQRLAGYDLGTEKVEVQSTPVTATPVAANTVDPATQATAVSTATTEVATAQPAATSAPEATVDTTDTSGTGGELPAAGVPDGTPMALISAVLIASLVLVVAGTTLRRKRL